MGLKNRQIDLVEYIEPASTEEENEIISILMNLPDVEAGRILRRINKVILNDRTHSVRLHEERLRDAKHCLNRLTEES